MSVSCRSETNLFDDCLFLILLSLFRFLVLIELVLSVVDNLAGWQMCLRGDTEKIHLIIVGFLECDFHRDDTEAFALGSDEEHLFEMDSFVD